MAVKILVCFGYCNHCLSKKNKPIANQGKQKMAVLGKTQDYPSDSRVREYNRALGDSIATVKSELVIKGTYG